MLTVEELQAKRDRFRSWATVIGLGVVGLLVAPFIFLAIGGLLGLGVAAAIGFVLVNLAPWFALKVANWKYRLMEAEKVEHIKKVTEAAAENPIETMTNLLHQKRRAFKDFEANVVNATTARDTFKIKVEKFSKNYPHRAAEFQKQLDRMIDLVERKKGALADAQQSLKDGEMKLEEMKAYWEMSKDAMELNRAAGMDTGDAFEKLKHDTACDAVFESMNRAFAELEVAAALDVSDEKEEAPTQLGYSEPTVLEVPVREVQKVRK